MIFIYKNISLLVLGLVNFDRLDDQNGELEIDVGERVGERRWGAGATGGSSWHLLPRSMD